jgi:hypothetical protein
MPTINTATNGRWTLTIESPTTSAVNIRFASESAARSYREELVAKNILTGNSAEDDGYDDDDNATTYTVWFDPAANPSVNIPRITTTLRGAFDSPDAYDPSDF